MSKITETIKLNVSEVVDKVNSALESHLSEEDIADIVKNNTKDLKFDVMEIVRKEVDKDV